MIKNPNPLNVNEPKLGMQITQRKILAEVLNNKAVENSKITDICFNNQKYKTQMASIDVSGVLKIWDVAQGRLIQQFHASNMWLTTVDVEKLEGKKVACGTLDGKVLVYEINQGNRKGKSFSKDKANIELFGHSGSIQCVQFLSAQYIIAGSTDSLVSLWDLENPQRYLAIHQQHTGDVLSLHAYENDSNIFISGSSDLTCKIWDIRVKKPVQAEYKGHESAVNTVKFIQMPQPTTFVTGSDDASINLWDLRMKDPIVSFQDSCYYDSIYSIAISPSGRFIFAASENSTLKVFDVLGDTDIYTNLDVGLQQNDGLIKSIDISADGYALGMALGTKSNPKDLLVIIQPKTVKSMHLDLTTLVLLSYWIGEVWNFDPTILYTGCQDDANICTKLCRFGFATCNNPKTITCEYNYFKLTLKDSIECVKCPQSFEDSMMYMCMDCRENSETWQNTRTCTYNYKIKNGKTNGAFVRENITTPILFNIQSAIQINEIDGRNATVLYEVDECVGCSEFCDDYSDTCYILDEQVDVIHTGVMCLDGYFMFDNTCTKCNQDNCKSCDQFDCYECQQGFAFNYDTYTCIRCFAGCLSCQYYGTTQYCDNCVSDIGYNYMIPVQYGEQCAYCDYGCIRCQMTYSNDDGKEIIKCRQCEQGSIIHNEGNWCEQCQVVNCDICYNQYSLDGTTSLNTYTLNFQQGKAQSSAQKCYKCKDGYSLDPTSGACQTITGGETKCKNFKGSLCLSCKNQYVLEYTSPTVNACNENILCSKQIKYCTDCISFSLNGQTQYQCLKCDPGFYPDVFAGLCIQCQSRCTQCWQYTDSYNITDYLQLQMAALNPAQFLLDMTAIQSEKLNDPWCTLCQDGFDLYNNECKGCTDNCNYYNTDITVPDIVSACQFLDDTAYCSQCSLTKYQKSLVSDASECIDCPDNCVACRERTEEEIQAVNPFFNPDFDQLVKYSNFCYMVQPTIPADQILYIDSVLGTPITCPTDPSNPKSKYKKCSRTIQYDTNIGCENTSGNAIQLLTILKKQKGKVITITLKEIENAQQYNQFNQQGIIQLDIAINFQPSDQNACSFPKPVQIKSQLQQNIFTLQKLTLTINGNSDSQVKFKQTGRLILQDYSSVIISNIIFSEIRSGDFGIEILGSKTSLTMINCKVMKINKLSVFSIILQNTIFLYLSGVSFENINNDNIFNQTQTTLLTDNAQFILEDVTITQSSLKYGLLTINQIGSGNTLTINNFNILDSVVNNTQLFNDIVTNPPFDIKVTNVKVIYTNFYNSSIFNFGAVKSLSIGNLDFAVGKLDLSSTLVTSPSFNINKCFFFRTMVKGNSQFFKSSSYIYYQEQIPFAGMFSFSYLTFQYATCQNINCFMKLSTPENTFNLKSNITIAHLTVRETIISSIQSVDINSVTSALISFNNIGYVSLQTMTISNSQGLSIFFIGDSNSIDIQNAQYYLEKDNDIYYYYDDESVGEFDINYDLGDYVFLRNPVNKLLPSSVECASRKIAAYEYTSYFFYIEGFQGQVSMKHLTITDQIFIDRSAIVIKSYQNLQFMQPEIIILQDIQFLYNRLASVTNGQEMSLIHIESEQQQTINITAIQFQDNHMHQLVDSQTSETPLCLLVNSPYSELNIEKGYFNYNRVTRSLNGLIWAKVNSITLFQTYFYKTNILDTIWLDYLEEQQLIADDSNTAYARLESYFVVQSYGANLFAIAKLVNFWQVNIAESYGISGAGVYLELTDGIVFIVKSTFQNIQSSLEISDNTEGGCLLINSESSKMQLEMSEVIMQNCTARTRGGCIHVFSTKFKQEISIKDSQFSQCQSFGYSFISNPFLESTDTPMIQLENVIVSDNNYDIFLNNIPDMSLLEQLLLTENSGIYYQHTGVLIIKNSVFSNFKYLNIIQAVKMTNIFISETKFQSNILFIMPLLQLTLDPIYQNQLVVVSSEFSNNNSTNIASIQKKCDSYILKGISLSVADQTCDIVQYLIDFYNYFNQDEISWNDMSYVTKYEEYPDNQKFIDSLVYEIYYQEETEVIQKFNTTKDNTLINCLQVNLLNLTLEAGKTLTTSLVYVGDVYGNSFVKFEKTNIILNNCLRCSGGLMQFLGVDNKDEKQAIIVLQDVKCDENIVGYYGCFLIQSTKSLLDFVPNQNLEDLSTLESRFRILQLDQNHTLEVNNSAFSNNKARVGSGISVIGLSALVNESTFSDNSASIAGAGVYYINVGGEKPTKLFVNSLTFQNNQAQVGAALYLLDTELAKVDKLNINFGYNKAMQAGNIQENTRRQTISMSNGSFLPVETYLNYSGDYNNDGNIDNIGEIIKDNVTLQYQKIGTYPSQTNLMILPSGQSINKYNFFYKETQEYVPFEWIFRIINLNRFYEPIVNDHDGDKCSISGRIQQFQKYDDTKIFTKNFTIPIEAQFSENDRGYVLDSMQVTFDPQFDSNYFLELKFECDTMAIPVFGEAPAYNIIGYDTQYSLYANIRTFPCQKGEVYQLQRCVPCDTKSNQYSVIVGATLCSQFNSDQMVAIKQSSIQLKRGYWRPDYDNDLSQYCENLDVNCNGGWVPGDPSCFTGHIGALCESCDLYTTVYEEAYTQTSAYKCAKCAPTMQLNYIVLIATSITSFISMVLAVKGSYLSSMQFIIEDTLESWGVRLKSSESDLAVLMKVLTNYFQIIQFIGSFQIALPSSLTQTAKTGGNPSESTTTAMDCLYVTMTDLNVLYFRLVWGFIQPAIYLVGFYIVYFIGVTVKIAPYKINIITTALIYEFLLLQPAYVEGFIVLASSRTISGYPYVQRDVAYRYDSDQHQYYLLRYIMPMLLVWVLVLPLFLMFLIYKNKATLETKKTKLIYGFFYLEYQINSYLWEFVKLFQKEFMVIILSYYDEEVIVKGLLLVVVMFLYGFYQIQVSPYKNKRLNIIDRFSTVILAISLAMGVLLKQCQDQDFGYLFIIVAIIIILLNIPFLISILYYIFEGYIVKLSPILDKIRDIINEKYPNLGKDHPWLRPYLFNKEKMGVRVKELWCILRAAVYESDEICKKHELPFRKVFPPYALRTEDGASINDNHTQQPEEQEQICKETKPLISDQQREELIPEENQFSAIRSVSQFPNGVRQQGSFFVSSMIFQDPTQEHVAITGQGVEKWPDNTEYQGQIVNGKKQGKGIVKWPLQEGKQQEFYEGNFTNDKFDDYGVYHWSDGKVYEGKWKEGKRHGYGKYQGKNQYYEGEFENDLYHGQGILKIGNKQITGSFINGKMDGEMQVQVDKKKRKGVWKEGNFQKWIN